MTGHWSLSSVLLNQSAVSHEQRMSSKKQKFVLSPADKIKILDCLNAGETRQSIIKDVGIRLRRIERVINFKQKDPKKSNSCPPIDVFDLKEYVPLADSLLVLVFM